MESGGTFLFSHHAKTGARDDAPQESLRDTGRSALNTQRASDFQRGKGAPSGSASVKLAAPIKA